MNICSLSLWSHLNTTKMPQRDQTGPMGSGSMTGRGMGSCNNNDTTNTAGRGLGRGAGMGRRAGGGFGQRHGFAFRSNDNSVINRLAADIEGLKEDVKKLLGRLSS